MMVDVVQVLIGFRIPHSVKMTVQSPHGCGQVPHNTCFKLIPLHVRGLVTFLNYNGHSTALTSIRAPMSDEGFYLLSALVDASEGELMDTKSADTVRRILPFG